MPLLPSYSNGLLFIHSTHSHQPFICLIAGTLHRIKWEGCELSYLGLASYSQLFRKPVAACWALCAVAETGPRMGQCWPLRTTSGMRGALATPTGFWKTGYNRARKF
jgi:hypothetical protein